MEIINIIVSMHIKHAFLIYDFILDANLFRTGLLTRKPRLLLPVWPDCEAHPAECELTVVLVAAPEEEEREDSSLSPYLMSHKDLEHCS